MPAKRQSAATATTPPPPRSPWTELPPELRAVVLAHLPPTALCRFAGVQRHALADADAVSVGAVSALRAADPADVATRLAHTSQRVERHVATELGLLPKDKKAPPHAALAGVARGAAVGAIVDAVLAVPDATSTDHAAEVWSAARTQRIAEATAKRAKARDLARRRGEAQAKRLAQIAAWLRTEQPYGPDVLDYGAFTQRMQAMTAQIGDYVHERPYLYVPGSVLQYVSNVLTTAPKWDEVRATSSPTATASSTSTRASSTSWPTSSPVASSCPSRPKRSRGLGAAADVRRPPGPDDPAPFSLDQICADIEGELDRYHMPAPADLDTQAHTDTDTDTDADAAFGGFVRRSLPLRHVAGGPLAAAAEAIGDAVRVVLLQLRARGGPGRPPGQRARGVGRDQGGARGASTSTARPPRSSRCRRRTGRGRAPTATLRARPRPPAPAVAHRRRRRPRRTAPRRGPTSPCAAPSCASASPRGRSDPASVSVRKFLLTDHPWGGPTKKKKPSRIFGSFNTPFREFGPSAPSFRVSSRFNTPEPTQYWETNSQYWEFQTPQYWEFKIQYWVGLGLLYTRNGGLTAPTLWKRC